MNYVQIAQIYFVLSHFVYFTVDMWRRFLTITHTTAYSSTARTFEIWVVCNSYNAKFSL